MIDKSGIDPIHQHGAGFALLKARPKVMRSVDHQHELGLAKELLDSYLHFAPLPLCSGQTDRGSQLPEETCFVRDSAQANETGLTLMLSAPRLRGSRLPAAGLAFNHD